MLFCCPNHCSRHAYSILKRKKVLALLFHACLKSSKKNHKKHSPFIFILFPKTQWVVFELGVFVSRWMRSHFVILVCLICRGLVDFLLLMDQRKAGMKQGAKFKLDTPCSLHSTTGLKFHFSKSYYYILQTETHTGRKLPPPNQTPFSPRPIVVTRQTFYYNLYIS